ncbi:hypothetical protein BOSE62_150029 [Bosea sp. 62]|nr:hypothetical protein BOSE7B_150098 [Bosea sp. 7B]VVT43446.1 hypothetical protein BOS5A_10032 [Bosea sp. EC-HK365B]VXB65054.1 hypothetical protein BOSE62_150029 [Bosea sp. 62]
MTDGPSPAGLDIGLRKAGPLIQPFARDRSWPARTGAAVLPAPQSRAHKSTSPFSCFVDITDTLVQSISHILRFQQILYA